MPTIDRAPLVGPGLSPDRHLPDFIVIGAMRAGTTTLYHHLAQHPEIGMSRMKETDFFIPQMNYPLGIDWYRDQFQPGHAVYGEVSPNYAMYHLWPEVPYRIKQAAPDARLIFIARNPVDRFVSHYLTAWHVGFAKVPPSRLIDSRNGRNMLEASRYAAQLRHFLQHFDMTQLLVLDFDSLCTDPQGTMDQVTRFLNVSDHVVTEVATRNETDSIARIPGFVQRAWRSRAVRRFDRYISRDMRNTARRILSIGPRSPDPEIGPELRAIVRERLADDVKEFRDMTGMEFSSWSK